jgi:hypothetical protein
MSSARSIVVHTRFRGAKDNFTVTTEPSFGKPEPRR